MAVLTSVVAVVRYALPSKVSPWRDLKDLEVDGVGVVIANTTVLQRTQRERRADALAPLLELGGSGT